MRFHRQQRHPFDDTSRKRVFLEKKLARERPLDPWWVRDRQVSEIMADRAARWSLAEARDRRARAENWRHVRRRYFGLSDNERAVVRAYWREKRWGGISANDLLMLLHDLLTGKVSLDELQAKTAASAAVNLRYGRQ